MAALLVAAACATASSAKQRPDYLFVWASDTDKAQSDFLAVLDAGTGRVISTAPTGTKGSAAHHTEHFMPKGGRLFANGFGAGRTWIFDLRNPTKPTVAGDFGDTATLMHAHSFERLPNGNVLATYQMGDHRNDSPGGLAEIAPDGRILRTSSAADPAAKTFIRAYSLAVVPKLDRVVTTTSDMHSKGVAETIQIWRLSDLKLLLTLPLPPGPRGKEQQDSAEPRLLPDGRTVMVNTFNCGLYRLTGLETVSPRAQFVHDFGTGECALPVLSGRYWVQTDTGLPGLVSLDLSDPSSPRVVDRLKLAEGEEPHWISIAPDGRRIVISSGRNALKSKVMLATIDQRTGKLVLERKFVVDFDRATWPHGDSGPAIPHGAVFSR
ncbi:MAG: selenium-binding family protein [Sphingomonas bacterium]|nr:selenium-binding family protein [Sphingomonas bacterium]